MDDATQVGAAVEGGPDFVSTDQIRAAADKAGLDPAATAALAEDNSKAQLGSLKVGLLTTALLARRAWRLIRTAEVSSFCCAVPSQARPAEWQGQSGLLWGSHARFLAGFKFGADPPLC